MRCKRKNCSRKRAIYRERGESEIVAERKRWREKEERKIEIVAEINRWRETERERGEKE